MWGKRALFQKLFAMANIQTPPAPKATSPVPKLSLSAGFLSYLIPGLGQIVQGRTGKGLLFLISLLAMFAYGMYLDDWRNVYLADNLQRQRQGNWSGLAATLYNRPQYIGQFWIGIAAWPAIWQYNRPVPAQDSPFWQKFEHCPDEAEINRLQTNGDKTWDLGWVFTVIAGVLNVLVIYDAAAGPAQGLTDVPSEKEPPA
jgi:hypothetical protein